MAMTMKHFVLIVIFPFSLLGISCNGKTTEEPEPRQCTEEETQVGDECISRIGPETCGSLLSKEGDACVVNLPECTEEQVYSPAGCIDVGENRDCGSGTWGDVETSEGDVFVNASHSGPENGTREEPYTTIQDGLDDATSGHKVVLAEGTYDGNIEVPAGVTLEGTCADAVVIEGSGDSPTITLTDADDSAIRGITIKSDGVGLDISSSENVTIEQVEVIDAVGAGIHFRDLASGIIGDSGIFGSTRLDEDFTGFGLLVDSGSSVGEVRSSVFSSNGSAGVKVKTGILTMEECLVRDNGRYGVIVDSPSGDINIASSRISKNGWAGVAASGSGSPESKVLIEESVIEETTNVPTDEGDPTGDGIMAVADATVEISGCIVRMNARFGVSIGAATAIIGDSGIFGNGAGVSDTDTTGGVATMGSEDGSTRSDLTITGTTISDNHGSGILAWGTDATIEDSVLQNNMPKRPEAAEGDGILATEGTQLTVSRSLIDGGTDGRLGILVDTEGSGAIIGDSGLKGMRYSGIWFQDKAEGSVSKSVITQVAFAGIGLVRESGSASADGVEITGCTISKVEPGIGLSDGGTPVTWADGVAVMAGSSAKVHDNEVKEVERAGIIFSHSIGKVTENTIEICEYGIAVQDLGPEGVEESGNSISDASKDNIARDENLPVYTEEWDPER